MRIAFDVRKLNDFGIGTYIRNLILHLAQLDQDSEYLLIGRERDKAELGALPANFSYLFDHTQESTFWNDFVLPYTLKKRGVQILHTPHYRSPRFYAANRSLPFMIVSTFSSPTMPVQSRPTTEARKITRRTIKQSSHILTVSEATQRDLMRLFSIPEEKITVVYNAIDERAVLTSDVEEQKRVLERYQIQDPFLLYAGNIKPHKNIARLIEAFSVLKTELKENETWKNLKLLIIGDELSKHQFLRRTVIRSGVQHDVRFFGYVPYETLKVFYKSAEIFAFPSLYEGFGLPPLEAMANGTPVLTSNVSSLPEVMGNAALLVNPENVFEICKGLKHLLFDFNLRAELIAKGLEQSRLYSWKKSAELVWQTYQKVTAGR